MAKKKVFVSYDYDKDRYLKDALFHQAKLPDSPFAISDYSLEEDLPDPQWLSKAQSLIAKCDFFVVILGRRTHRFLGVLKEVKIAKSIRKKHFQLMPQNQDNTSIESAGAVVKWTWENLKARLNR